MSRTEKLLADLVALPSVNPAFAPAAGSSGSSAPPLHGEKRVAEFLAANATKIGLEIEFAPVERDGSEYQSRYNLLVRLLPKNKIKRTIVLAPHLDTVGATEAQLVPRWKNGRLYGRGACDTKGSVAAMFVALCELAGSPARPLETEIVFAGLVDEEHAQAGSRALAASGFKADLAIVGEPTQLLAVTAHKGSLWLDLETRGRAAHGATPHLGQNAIHEMARVVDVLESGYAAQLRRRKHRLLGVATVNVGMIFGGTQPNIVPEACVIAVDRRTLPGETDARVMREIAARLRKEHLRAKISNRKIAPAPALETAPMLPLVRQFFSCLGQTRPVGVDYFCDAAILAGAGIPSIVFGPGHIAQAHTADEWISLTQLERAKNLLVRFLKSLS
jgi:acetylornithine deacetylase/succinyl-diaminopimelate desuccinylase-like protein